MPALAEGVRPRLWPPGVFADAERRPDLSSARARRRPVLRRPGRRQPLRPCLRPGISRARPRHRRRGSGRPVAGGARGGADPPLPPAVHPLCRGPGFAAGPRPPLRRLRSARAGPRRYRPPQGPQRRLFGYRRPLLVGARRSLPCNRFGRPVDRAAALQWRAVRCRAHAAIDDDPPRRCRHGECDRRPLVRAHRRRAQIHQLSRSERAAARLDLRAPAGA